MVVADVDSAVTSDARGAGFDSSHRKLSIEQLPIYISRTEKNKEKEARNGPFLGKKESSFGVKRISNPRTIQDDVPG